MGLRTASVRRPHVAPVMAPALTDTQSPTFKLPPKPASPINSYETNKYVSNAKDSFHKGSNPYNINSDELDTLETLLNNKCLTNLSGASDNSLNIMNNSPPLMGDQGDKMGLQKTALDSVSNMQKSVKSANDVEQLFNNLTSVLPGGDLGQELMQVIKSMETPNDLNNESDEVFPLTSFEKELLNDVDVMNMSMDQQDEMEDLKETQAKDFLQNLQNKQAKYERRLDFLKRRVCKLQARFMGQHISGEIGGVYELVHRQIKKAKEMQENSLTNNVLPTPSESFSAEKEKPKPLPYGATKSLVKKLEMTTLLQANSASRQRHVAKYFGSGSMEPSVYRSSATSMVNIPAWPLESKNELQKVTGLLKTELELVQKQVDSEATESSSGGESCDEMQTYNNPHQQYLSIQKRALWKYSTDRAAIAARWTWLQAQISDLEYRIRQHTDLHKQIRTGKGAITLGGASPPPPPPHLPNVPASPTAVNGYRGQLPGNSPDCANGAVLSSGLEYQCARTRPLVNFKKRKLLPTAGLHVISKKAARPSSMRCGCAPMSVPCALCTGRTDPTHPRNPPETLGKAERIALLDPSYHPVFSLPEDASQSIHLEAIMKTSEWQQKSTRMKTLKVMSRAEKLEMTSLEHRSKKLEHRKKYGRLLKPSTMSALSAKLKNKMRGRKASRHSLNRLSRKRHTAKVAMAQLNALASEGADDEIESIGNSAMGLPSMDSPSSSPLLQMQSISGYTRKNRIHSYDIDNIVIPYSVAASTRVEKLQYKEILTPKWRLADPDFGVKSEVKNNGIVRDPSQDEDAEDLCEESVVARHDRCEHDEKKKFLSYLKLPLGYGRRSHKRTDSRAESSGANTPDPMSPSHGGGQAGPNASNNNENASPLASPPATPLPPALLKEEEAPMAAQAQLPSVSVMRRRTMSQSRFAKDRELKEEQRCNTPEEVPVEVQPYETRTFPLNEDIYDKMVKVMPDDHHEVKTNAWAQDPSADDSFGAPPIRVGSTDEGGGAEGARPIDPAPAPDASSLSSYLDDKMVGSPGSESTESALGDEDPNDPEWIDVERSSRDRHKR
ncbi:unnamed protein product [Brassicogethes aeneus]|uniref:PEHE domain-containing protein n=1 Tax=Brassicogethes aeneus TaxID=1431903 RepID=A0A9P0FHH5_BRAAE|nr:unnamed protein product [Brassicogethes aeneus]